MNSAALVTMADVAKAAGVARSTVSKALRNDPTIPAARCVEVQKIAVKLGYRAHPMVSALMAQLHRTRRRSDPYHIAWIDLWPAGPRAVSPILWKGLLAGAKRRAQELGYDIELYRVERDGISADRLKRIMTARAQWGIIIPPVPSTAMHFPLDLRGLTGVTIGTSLRSPVMHRIASNHFQGAQLACERLREKGFRRIGLVLSPAVNSRIGGRWHGAFLASQSLWPRGERLPPCLVEPDAPAAFFRWLEREKPDAILLDEIHVLEWLRGGKHRPHPQVAWLAHDSGPADAWGIDHQPEQIGAAAVELVVGQIHRNTRGSPEVPHTLLLEGVWVET